MDVVPQALDRIEGLLHDPSVSILVLMDVVPQVRFLLRNFRLPRCFNPCFDGCGSSSSRYCTLALSLASFNPCFDGCGSSSPEVNPGLWWLYSVSILVLMDVVPQAG